MSDFDVTECPDCGETGHYDRRVTIGGRGIYACPNRHRWQDADETPDSKGYVPLDRADRIAVDAPEGGGS